MSDSKILVVIPARFESSRFPGKPLALIQGKPMIQRVWEGAIQAKSAHKVIVATDDDRIASVATDFGACVMMTKTTHKNGTERVAEVAEQEACDIVVNLQGDLPLFKVSLLDHIMTLGAELISKGDADWVSAKSEITTEEELFSPNTVKVISDHKGRALYFSRSPIPYCRPGDFKVNGKGPRFFKHYGIYCYAKAGLLEIVQAPESSLEKAEKLEQLRMIERGGRINLIELAPEAAASFLEVNCPEDIEQAESFLAKAQ